VEEVVVVVVVDAVVAVAKMESGWDLSHLSGLSSAIFVTSTRRRFAAMGTVVSD
jgi:hypothetical protein